MSYIFEEELETLESYVKEGKVKEAIKFSNKLLYKDLRNKDVLFIKTKLFLILQDYNNAYKCIHYLNEISNFNDKKGNYIEGYILNKMGKYKDSMYLLKKINVGSEYSNGDEWIFIEKGISYYHLGKIEKAKKYLLKGYKLQKLDIKCVFYLLSIYFETKDFLKYEELLKHLNNNFDKFAEYNFPEEFDEYTRMVGEQWDDYLNNYLYPLSIKELYRK